MVAMVTKRTRRNQCSVITMALYASINHLLPPPFPPSRLAFKNYKRKRALEKKCWGNFLSRKFVREIINNVSPQSDTFSLMLYLRNIDELSFSQNEETMRKKKLSLFISSEEHAKYNFTNFSLFATLCSKGWCSKKGGGGKWTDMTYIYGMKKKLKRRKYIKEKLLFDVFQSRISLHIPLCVVFTLYIHNTWWTSGQRMKEGTVEGWLLLFIRKL